MQSLTLFNELYFSLAKSERFGLLGRNMAQYDRFLARGAFSSINVLTYDRADHEILPRLQREGKVPDNVVLLSPPRWLRGKLGAIVYSVIAPILHRRVMSQTTVLRTQQVSGAWTAAIAKALFGTPLLFRVGYPLSVRFATEGKRLKHQAAKLVEKLLLRICDQAAVTSRSMQRQYSQFTEEGKVTFLPSYVDVSGLTPIERWDPDAPLLFVGRLSQVKNVDNLIRACAKIDMPLHIYGTGPDEEALRDLARQTGANVSFKGIVAHAELMKIHQKHTFFVLCSHREGMPKALIEAMGSGLICITTRTDGGLEMVRDGETGYVATDFDAESIAAALAKARSECDAKISRAAATYVREHNSLERSVDMELAIIERICAPVNDEGHMSVPSL